MEPFFARIGCTFPSVRRGKRRLTAVPVTWAIVLINAAAFVFDCISSGPESAHAATLWGRFDPEAVWSGEWWRLITHAFIHHEFNHVAWNLVGILLFGYLLEPSIKAWRFLFIYIATAVGSVLVTLLIDPAPGLGASGAIYGIAGAYLALLWRTPEPWLRSRAVQRRWLWTLLTIWFVSGSWESSDIDHIAHLSGLAIGLWYGYGLPIRNWTPRRVRQRLRSRRRALGACYLVVALLAVGTFWQPGWWYTRAASAAKNGDWTTAESRLVALERCAVGGEDNDNKYMLKAANLCMKHGDRLRARSLLAKSAPGFENPLPYALLGDLQARVEPYQELEALDSYTQALSRDPDYHRALVGLAILKIGAEDSTIFDPEGARDLARRAVDATGASVPSELYILAEAEFECGNTEEAIHLVEKALELHPENPEDYRGVLSAMRTALAAES